MDDRLIRSMPFFANAKYFACIWIGGELRKIARGNFQTNSVTGLEEIAGWPNMNMVLVYAAWFNRRRI